MTSSKTRFWILTLGRIHFGSSTFTKSSIFNEFLSAECMLSQFYLMSYPSTFFRLRMTKFSARLIMNPINLWHNNFSISSACLMAIDTRIEFMLGSIWKEDFKKFLNMNLLFPLLSFYFTSQCSALLYCHFSFESFYFSSSIKDNVIFLKLLSLLY